MALELRRRGYTPFVGALSNAEIDFIAKRGGDRVYIQVTTSLLDEEVYQRELASLESLNDSFPKMILVLDGWREGITDSGVRIRGLRDWLLDK